MELPIHLLSDNFIKTRHITKDTPFEIRRIEGRMLLRPERIDLAAKIAYIEARESGGDMAFARELYRKHIEAFSEGYFTEPGDNSKTSLDCFFSAFDALIDDYKANGFDEKKSLVPIGRDNIILDGAHRTACAIYFGGTVTVISFPQFEVNFDYRYFRSRRLSEEMLEYMAVVYSRYAAGPLYLACIWPAAPLSGRADALSLIRREHGVVFDTSVMLKYAGLRNFMVQIYQNQEWIGTAENHFAGVTGKADACFVPGGSTEAVLFEGGTLEDVLNMKERIRDIFRLGKHAIHISDSNEETGLMASLLFNVNSRHALNYGRPDAFPARFYEMEAYRGTGISLGYTAALAYYGIADAGPVVRGDSAVDAFDPRSYFAYDGMKLPALSRLTMEDVRLDREAGKKAARLIRLSGGEERKRRAQDVKTALTWHAKKAELRCKQIAMRLTQKLGVYDLIYRMRHR